MAQLSARLADTELLLFQHSFNETLCQPFKIRFGLVAPVSFFSSPSIPRSPLLSLLVSLLSSATVARATEQPGDRWSDRALSTGRPIHAGGCLVMDSYETFKTIPPKNSYISKETRQTQFFQGLGGPLSNNWAHLIHIGYILQSLVRTFDQCQLPETMVRCKESRPALRNQSCWERFQSAPLSGSTRSEEVGVKPVRRIALGNKV